jgi:hypothetical protein
MYIGLHEKCWLSLNILMELQFSRQILKNRQTSNFVKIRLVGVHADGQTDMTMYIVAFRNFVNGVANSECSSNETECQCLEQFWKKT